ncbi:MAG: (Fe-S)-binding protein [Bacteroidetes bacterium]|nr:MAG: (Fe-S)-binding protein [Bacteroidota bacterium]
MAIVFQLLFVVLLGMASFFAYKSFSRIRKNILLGKDEKREGSLKNMVLMALGQKKMFDKPIPALLHLAIYVGFLVVNLEMIEIVIDGIFGTHRVFFGFLGSAYPVFISIFELFAAAVILSCIAFFARRHFMNINRFKSADLEGFARKDADTILYIEVVLMCAFLSMNAADLNLQKLASAHYPTTGNFLISNQLTFIFAGFSESTLIAIERLSWWLHIIGVMLFLNYLPYSKHLHIMLAFPNTYFANQEVYGKMKNMPEITKEVKSMLSIPLSDAENQAVAGKFGAKDINDLSWKNLLDAYTCTECGRCTSACPANITGKILSPRKIMMATRDRMEDVAKNNYKLEDGKSLLNDYISHEALLACTSCNACADACPVNINPLEIITQLKRFKIMEESAAPQSWNMVFSNLETSFAPWKFSASDRFNWAKDQG